MGARGVRKGPRPSRLTAVLSGFALLAVGVVAVTSQDDPAELPAGKYVLRMSVTDRNSNKLSMVSLPVEILAK